MITEVLVLLLVLALTSFFSGRSYVRRKKSNLPPGPFKFPFVGNLPQMIPLSHRSLGVLSRLHGPLMHLQIGRSVVIVASSASMAREVMLTHDVEFASRLRLMAAERLSYGCKDVVFAPYGDHWRQMKRICVVHLLSTKQVQSYRSVREEEVASLVQEISQRSSLQKPVDLSAMLRTYTSSVVCRVALGRNYQGRWNLVERVSALIGEFFVEDYFPWLSWISWVVGKHDKLRRCFREVDSFLEEVIEDHVGSHRLGSEDKMEGRDLVDVMLALQKADDTGAFLTRDSMKAMILDMFGAGTETSALTLEWAMSELVRKPTLLKKAQDEVRATAGTKSIVTEDDLDKLDYVKAVMKETLRLHPPVPLLVPRETLQDAEISGFNIPAGAQVLVNVWAIGRDPQEWEAPEEFMPERFLNASAADYKGQHFHFLPFGAGRRMCPGVGFAIYAGALALANLLHSFDWKLPGGRREEDLDMMETNGLVMSRKTSLVLVAVPKDMKGL